MTNVPIRPLPDTLDVDDDNYPDDARIDEIRLSNGETMDPAQIFEGKCMTDLETALQQSRATANARRTAIRMAYQQIEFLRGTRKRAWKGDFLRRICEAAAGERDGCMICNGTMEISGSSYEPHIPGYPDPCPDCDPSAPGFSKVSA